MKKFFFAVFAVAAIAACNSPQEITSPTTDSSSTMMTTPTDTVSTTPIDTMMGSDTAKRDTLR